MQRLPNDTRPVLMQVVYRQEQLTEIVGEQGLSEIGSRPDARTRLSFWQSPGLFVILAVGFPDQDV